MSGAEQWATAHEHAEARRTARYRLVHTGPDAVCAVHRLNAYGEYRPATTITSVSDARALLVAIETYLRDHGEPK